LFFLVKHWHSLRPRAHQGNWQPQQNHDFWEVLSARVEHVLVNGAVQIEETATQISWSLRNSISRQWNMPVFTPLSCCVDS
jgi:hypothetical protein